MAVWSEANSSIGLTSGRIDAEFFRPAFLRLEQTLNSCDTVPLSRYFHISDGNHLEISRHFTANPNDIPYFRGQDLNGFFLENSEPERIPKSVYDRVNMHRSHFAAEDVLVCIVGASTGTIALVAEGDTPCTGSCKIGLIRRNPDGPIDSFFLAAFLHGKFGQYQIKRHSRGTAQGGLILKDVFKLLVPLFAPDCQLQVHALVEESVRRNAQANLDYAEALQVLDSELGLDKLDFHSPVDYASRFSTVNLNRAFAANRFDAQCFAPRALFYDEWLTSHARCDRLSLLLGGIASGDQQTENQSGDTDYCSIKHICGREIVTESKCIPVGSADFAELDDLLLAVTGATIGKIGIVKRYSKLAYSGDLLRLRVRQDINPHYVLLALDHSLGQIQFNRWITGSTNGHLAPRDVGRVLVPRLSPIVEDRIGDLVAKSLSEKLESERSLEKAKTHVELLIEGAAQT